MGVSVVSSPLPSNGCAGTRGSMNVHSVSLVDLILVSLFDFAAPPSTVYAVSAGVRLKPRVSPEKVAKRQHCRRLLVLFSLSPLPGVRVCGSRLICGSTLLFSCRVYLRRYPRPQPGGCVLGLEPMVLPQPSYVANRHRNAGVDLCCSTSPPSLKRVCAWVIWRQPTNVAKRDCRAGIYRCSPPSPLLHMGVRVGRWILIFLCLF